MSHRVIGSDFGLFAAGARRYFRWVAGWVMGFPKLSSSRRKAATHRNRHPEERPPGRVSKDGVQCTSRQDRDGDLPRTAGAGRRDRAHRRARLDRDLVLGRPEAITDQLQGVGGCDGVSARHAPATWSDTLPDRDKRAFRGDQMRHVIHLAVDSDRPHIWVRGESRNHPSRMRDVGFGRREA
jgi:hypothetical protein